MIIPPCEHVSIFSDEERLQINEIGARSGCHTCGTKNPGTRSGNWIGDFQPPGALNWASQKQRIYPHCLFCKKCQGAGVRNLVATNGIPESHERWEPGCITFISDVSIGRGPLGLSPDANIWATGDCVAVGLMSFMDGMTELVFGRAETSTLSAPAQFDGVIATPSQSLAVSTPEGFILGMPEPVGPRTRIRIWADHLTEPARIDTMFG